MGHKHNVFASFSLCPISLKSPYNCPAKSLFLLIQNFITDFWFIHITISSWMGAGKGFFWDFLYYFCDGKRPQGIYFVVGWHLSFVYSFISYHLIYPFRISSIIYDMIHDFHMKVVDKFPHHQHHHDFWFPLILS